MRDRGKDGGVFKIIARRSVTADRENDKLENPIIINYEDDGLRAEIITEYPTPAGGKIAGYGVNLAGELLVLAQGKPRALHRLDTITGELGEKLFQDEKYDLDGVRLYRHPVSRRLLGVQYTRQGPFNVWFEPAYDVVQAALDKALPQRVVRILGSDKAEKQFFVSVAADCQPPQYFRFNLEKKEVYLSAATAPWIDAQRMRPMQTMSYKTRDGFSMEGYVTLPTGATKETPAPLVVLPHARRAFRPGCLGWDREAQFLAKHLAPRAQSQP